MKARNAEQLIAAGLPQEKAEGLDRRGRRKYTLITERRGRRTGSTPHFKAWMAELKVKSILQKTRTDRLADSIVDTDGGAAGSGFALLFLGGYKNVWAVSQATKADLLKVRGFGPAKLAAIEEYLNDKNVVLKWTTN